MLRLEQPERIKSFATRTCHRGIIEDAGSRQNTTIAWMPDICGGGSIGMTRHSVPTRRQRGLLGAALAVWTAPTTFLGHAFARLSGCPEADRIDASGASAWLYRLPPGRIGGFGAVAIGHVIILEPAFLERHGPWLLAHELSHTRQHDWLGPAYLPLHAILQAVSVVFYFIRPIAKFSPWHAYNPLERVLICVPIDVIVDGPPEGELASKILREFGLTNQRYDYRASQGRQWVKSFALRNDSDVRD